MNPVRHCIGCLCWLLALAPSLCNGQKVYSVNIYVSGVTYEKSWLIGSPPNQWGLSQYSQWEDSRGWVIMNPGNEKDRRGVQHGYTRVHLGAASFSVRLPAGAVALIIAFFAIISIGMLAVALEKRLRQGKDQDVT